MDSFEAISKLFFAEATAASTSFILPETTYPIISSVDGFIRSIFSSPSGVMNSPLM